MRRPPPICACWRRSTAVFMKSGGNAGSPREFGLRAKAVVHAARDRIAKVIAAKRNESVFTSGAEIPRTPGREQMSATAEQGYLHCEPSGAGHFVKMVHNGIEYGIIAAYAEGLGVLRGSNIGTQAGSMPRRRSCAIPFTTSTSSICETSARSCGGAASSPRGCST
jgi:6-phosphogluconate dehydrogenase (decarboxylating)